MYCNSDIRYLIQFHLQIVCITSMREQWFFKALDRPLLEVVLGSGWKLKTSNAG